MSLNKAYQVLQKDGFLHSIAYWLALPTLLFAQALGCGKEPFDPKPYIIYYSKPELPTDLLSYDEYLQVMAAIKEPFKLKLLEVRDAQYC
jgi:hypothetical protein